MTSTEQLNCFYLDSSLKPASDMLRKCVQDESSPYMFDCGTDPMRQENTGDVKNTARMNDISIQRGITEFHVSGFDGDNVVMRPKVSENSAPKLNPLIDINLTEGFHNGSNVAHQARDQQFNAQMFTVNVDTKSFNEGFQNKSNVFVTDNGPGKSSIPYGQCPEGYSRCQKTGKCIQKCIGCVYRDNMKSREFNEADPCFPEGTYNGITNEGYIKCTCGSQNQYCSDDFVKNIFTTDGMMMSGQKIIMNVGNTNSISELFNFDYL